MNQDHPAFEKCPAPWIGMRDIETLSFEKATWIPLVVERVVMVHGQPGNVGHRKEYHDFDSIIVPVALQDEFRKVDWQSVWRNIPDSAWADDKRFLPPGVFAEDPRILYPVIQRSFDTGERTQWDILQEMEVGLKLLRQGNVWIRPDEDDIKVAKLECDQDGNPEALLFRAEHLRDYLCAKKAALLLSGFVLREAVEEDFPELNWATDEQARQFGHGAWEGRRASIHEGGGPYGLEIGVLRMWRESINPQDDVPHMAQPCAEPAAKSETLIAKSKGRKLFTLSGKVWVKHWIAPAQRSPRIKRDHVEARVHFQVENQEQKTLSGDALLQYRGWLWFKPSVIRGLLSGSKSSIKWFTENTGEVGPAQNLKLHFGVNKPGLINVLGKDMAELPEWAQKLWVAENISPEGGLSEELHMSQNLASPARTTAPEVMLWQNLQLLQEWSSAKYGQPLLQRFPPVEEFFRKVHRFYCDSFEAVCELCKELHRIVSEPIDIGLLNSKIDPANAVKANELKLRQIKRLALWLDSLGLDGRKVTQPLGGIADLRQGDAHAKGSELESSLALFGISKGEENLQAVCCEIIGQAANCVGTIANATNLKAGA